MILPAKLQEPNARFTWGIVQPDPKVQPVQMVLVCRTLVDLEHPTVPVQVMNLSTEPRKIGKGTHLASCEPIVCVLRHDDETAYNTGEQLPEHLRELYKRSTTDLNIEQRQDSILF